jgi:hypothetical protein
MFTFDLLNNGLTLIMASGLSGLASSLIKNWIGPVFLVIVAVTAFGFIRSQAWTKLIAFVGIAALVGALIFFGSDLFGQGGVISGMFTNAGKAVGGANNNTGAFSGQ